MTTNACQRMPSSIARTQLHSQPITSHMEKKLLQSHVLWQSFFLPADQSIQRICFDQTGFLSGFENCQYSYEHKWVERSELFVGATTLEIIHKIHDLVLCIKRLKKREIDSAMHISSERVANSLNQYLKMKNCRMF